MVEYSNLFIDIISAFLILILGLVIASIITNILKRLLKEAEIGEIIRKQLKIKIKIEYYIVSLAKYIIYFVTFILLLNQFGIPTLILDVILAVLLVIIIVFIVLAFKDWIPNFVSGLYIYKTQKIKTGDTIIINGVEGKVKEISLIETKILTKKNEVIFVPNSNITKYEVVKK